MASLKAIFLSLFFLFVTITGSSPVNCSPIVTTTAPSDCETPLLSPAESRNLYVQEIMPKLVSIAGNASIVFNHSSLAHLTVSVAVVSDDARSKTDHVC